jgi:hypothetical protein
MEPEEGLPCQAGETGFFFGRPFANNFSTFFSLSFFMAGKLLSFPL